MGDRVGEGLELAVEGFELGGAAPDALLQLFVELADLFLRPLAFGYVLDRSDQPDGPARF